VAPEPRASVQEGMCPRNVCRCGGGEEEGEAGDVGWHSEAACRLLGVKRFLAGLFDTKCRHFAGEQPGADSVDGDVRRAKFEGQLRC